MTVAVPAQESLGGHALVFRYIYNMERVNTAHSRQLVWKCCKTLYYRFDHSSSVRRTANHDFSTPPETLASDQSCQTDSRIKLPPPKNEKQAAESFKSQKDTGFLLPGKRRGKKKATVKFQVLKSTTPGNRHIPECSV